MPGPGSRCHMAEEAGWGLSAGARVTQPRGLVLRAVAGTHRVLQPEQGLVTGAGKSCKDRGHLKWTN